jgi:hypothetical protein
MLASSMRNENFLRMEPQESYTLKEKTERFFDLVKSNRSFILCQNCGSTLVDQNDSKTLICCTCGNTLPWDMSKFAIIRDNTPYDINKNVYGDDVITAFRHATCPRRPETE